MNIDYEALAIVGIWMGIASATLAGVGAGFGMRGQTNMLQRNEVLHL